MASRTSVATARSLVEAVRVHFGVGQARLAAYLGVSRSLVSMEDLNLRNLPTVAMLRLLPLGRALPPPWADGPADPPPAPAPPLAPPPPLPGPPAPAPLHRRLRACEAALFRAARALKVAERPALQARRLLVALPAMAATLPATDVRAQRQIPFLEADARDRFGPAPTAARGLRAARAEALRTEAAWLRAWLAASGES